jgi:molecular chaperone DnaJ
VPTHYDTLRVPPSATDAEIREAYRRLARLHHPDRVASEPVASDPVSMPQINEAYRVLGDPARRAVYDAGLRSDTSSRPATARSGPSTTSRAPSSAPIDDGPLHPSHLGPARFPWRSALVVGVLGVIAVVVLAQFTEPGAEQGPDGILRLGDCVTIEANGDAREVSCTGDASVDLTVEAFVPFSAPCPTGSTAHRDRQGMGVACVAPPDG